MSEQQKLWVNGGLIERDLKYLAKDSDEALRCGWVEYISAEFHETELAAAKAELVRVEEKAKGDDERWGDAYEHLNDVNNRNLEQLKAAKAENERLKSRLAECEKDAERWHLHSKLTWETLAQFQAYEAAIDAAIAERKEKP